MTVLEVKDGGIPGGFQVAHVLPPNPKGEMWKLLTYGDLGRLDINFEEFILDLEDELERAYAEFGGERGKEGVFLIGFSTVSRSESEESIAELVELARSAGKTVLERAIQIKKQPDPRYLIGKGKLKEIILGAKQVGADILIFDVELTPAQIKAISEETNLRVMDRTQLILEIFAQRARSSEGKIQVELASLRYTLPRLIGRGVEFSQLGGGIGTRGPGEQKIEEERRRIRDRISRLERETKELGRRRGHTRKRRTKAGVITVTLIGYTNAGKSTLFNTLTESSVVVEDKLFSTLNPTTRRLRLPGGREILLTDTVGFIKNLPEDLVKAFRATLEELGGSSLLIHLVDASDLLCEERVEAVEGILKSTGFDYIPRFIVLNKIDKVPDEIVWRLRKIYSAPAVSAPSGETFREFLERLDTEVDRVLLKEQKENFISESGEAGKSFQI